MELLGRDGWGSAFGSSYGGARGGGPMRGEYGSRDSGPYGGKFIYSFIIMICSRLAPYISAFTLHYIPVLFVALHPVVFCCGFHF